jgi:hypothetical protein
LDERDLCASTVGDIAAEVERVRSSS